MGRTPVSTVVLEYARAAPSLSRRGRLILFILWLPALIVPIVPFAWGVSPFQALLEFDLAAGPSLSGWGISLLGLTFFFGPFIVIWRIILLRGGPDLLARRAFVLLAFVFWIPFTLLFAVLLIENSPKMFTLSLIDTLGELWQFALALALALAGVLLTWRLAAAGDNVGAITTVLTTPYIANAALCLASFYDVSPQIGYLLTVLLTVVWLTEMTGRATGSFLRHSVST